MCVFLKENLCSQKACEQGFNKHKALWKERGGVWGGQGKAWGSPFLQKSFPSPPVFLQRLFFQTVLAHLPVQRGAADAEGKGRLTDVPAKTDEGGGDGLPLDVLKRRLRRGGLRFSIRSAIPKCSGNNAPPSARCTARSTALSNCRILPGHG